MRIDVFHHLVRDEGTVEVLALLRRIEGRLMSLADDLKAGLASLETHCNDLGTFIKGLAGNVKNTMTDAEVADVKGKMVALGDHMASLAADPNAPVPALPPVLAQAMKAKKP